MGSDETKVLERDHAGRPTVVEFENCEQEFLDAMKCMRGGEWKSIMRYVAPEMSQSVLFRAISDQVTDRHPNQELLELEQVLWELGLEIVPVIDEDDTD